MAFDVAERDARRLKDSSFTEVERKRLDTAKQLLTVAIDEAATPAERQLAYRRVREELDGLISAVGRRHRGARAEGDARDHDGRSAAGIHVTGRRATGRDAAAADQVRDATVFASAGRKPASGNPPAPPAGQAPRPAAEPKSAPWPVPARTTDTTPGRVIHPKPRP